MAEREDITFGKVTVVNELVITGATVTGGLNSSGTVVDLTVSGTETVATANITTASITTGTIAAASLTAAPVITGSVASSVTAFIKNNSGHAMLATCATSAIPTGAGYAKGCILIATDGTDHTNTVFANIGTSSAANFNAVTIASD